MPVISENSQVTLHFSLHLENGDLVDSTFDKAPATFTVGDGSLLPGFEKKLFGLDVGAKQQFIIEQHEAFGAHNPQNIQQFKRADFPTDAELSEGAMFSFADAAGCELPGVLKSVVGDKVEIDFNHPLAGHAIHFNVEIIDVQ
jgi:FKBP-type peptidyl-prolyl cis-trans isomerase SlpA